MQSNDTEKLDIEQSQDSYSDSYSDLSSQRDKQDFTSMNNKIYLFF